jgi:hypothetical protein
MSRRSVPGVSDKEKVRQSHILLSKYDRLYQQRHNARKVFNRYSAKWGMLDVIESLGYERTDQLLEYFFSTPSDHALETFYKTYDKLDANEKMISADRSRRAKIRRETQMRVMEEGN